MSTILNEYEQQAADFLQATETTINIIRDGVVDHFPNDTLKGFRYRYRVTLSRDGKHYAFPFYGSVYAYEHNQDITAYDVLACVEKYEPAATLKDFAYEFGYDIDEPEDRRRVNRIYQSCIREYKHLLHLFGEENMELLREIN